MSENFFFSISCKEQMSSKVRMAVMEHVLQRTALPANKVLWIDDDIWKPSGNKLSFAALRVMRIQGERLLGDDMVDCVYLMFQMMGEAEIKHRTAQVSSCHLIRFLGEAASRQPSRT